MQEWANEIDRLQREVNNGKPISYVDWIVQDLRKGDFHMAKVNYRNQSDKYDSYGRPKIREFFIKIGIAEDPEKIRQRRLKHKYGA